MVDLKILVGGIALLALMGFLVTSTDTFSTFDLDGGCSYQTVEIEGQTFSSLDELKQGYQERGVDFSKIKEKVSFRVEDGVLEYKPSDCGKSTVEGG